MLKKIVAAAALGSIALTGEAEACGRKPPRMSSLQIYKLSDAIVFGWLEYEVRAIDQRKGAAVYTIGRIIPSKLIKGPRGIRFSISHKGIDFTCLPWGWQPQRTMPPQRYVGYFYLFANNDGTFSIAQFRPGKTS